MQYDHCTTMLYTCNTLRYIEEYNDPEEYYSSNIESADSLSPVEGWTEVLII